MGWQLPRGIENRAGYKNIKSSPKIKSLVYFTRLVRFFKGERENKKFF